VATQLRPLLNSENQDGDFPLGQILLVSQILVCSQQDIEASRLGSRQ
jgi:hypothetical protein